MANTLGGVIQQGKVRRIGKRTCAKRKRSVETRDVKVLGGRQNSNPTKALGGCGTTES